MWIYIIAPLIICFITAALASTLATKKGYDGFIYFWLGFFLNVLGLIYVAGLPLLYKPQIVQTSTQDTQADSQVETQVVVKENMWWKEQTKTSKEENIPGSGKVCPSCGYEQALPRKNCYKCGTPLD